MKVLLLPNGLDSTVTEALANGYASRKMLRRSASRDRRSVEVTLNVYICREGMDTSLDHIRHHLVRLFEKWS